MEALVDGTTPGWVKYARGLPAEAMGKQIKIEFRLQSLWGGLAGWYIDDVQVRVP